MTFLAQVADMVPADAGPSWFELLSGAGIGALIVKEVFQLIRLRHKTRAAVDKERRDRDAQLATQEHSRVAEYTGWFQQQLTATNATVVELSNKVGQLEQRVATAEQHERELQRLIRQLRTYIGELKRMALKEINELRVKLGMGRLTAWPPTEPPTPQPAARAEQGSG